MVADQNGDLLSIGTGQVLSREKNAWMGWSSISEHRSVRCASANIGRYYLLDRFRLDLELPETRQGTARDVVRLEKINLAGGERWVGQEREQQRLDLGHRKGHRYEQSPVPQEV